MQKPLILLVEDERDTAATIAEFLTLKGMQVLTAHSGNRALELVGQHAATISVAVLDVMLPEKTGHEICRFIKEHPAASDIPVLFLTAKDREEDQISGIQLGADSYLAKPAGLNLIHTYVASLLKRFPRKTTGWLGTGNVWLNEETREIRIDGKPMDFTPTEFSLLHLFLKQPKRIFERTEIIDAVFQSDKSVFDRTVDAHIKNLRLKMGTHGDLIRTVRGVGYGLAL